MPRPVDAQPTLRPRSNPMCPQCGTAFLADPAFRHRAAEATGLPETTLEASVVADPHATVHVDVERLLNAPSLSPNVSVSGHVYDIATGRINMTVPARHPQFASPESHSPATFVSTGNERVLTITESRRVGCVPIR